MPHRIAITLAALLAAGSLTAIALGSSRSSQTTIQDLAGLGYTMNAVGPGPNGCVDYWASGNGMPAAWDMGSFDPACADPAGMQRRVDALILAYPPPAPPVVTTDPVTDTTVTDTTVTDTTPAPPASPPVVTTPDPYPQQITDLQAQVAALQQQIVDLTATVDRLTLAGTAADLAYQQAIASGSDTQTAAAIAYGTYLNAEYGLGAFAG
jgi:hypothetical protein